MVSDFYQRVLLRNTPRLLNLLDRDRFSPTFGCFDRPYWHYKALTDFPSAIYQQGTLTLSLIYTTPFRGNLYIENPVICDYIRAGMSFWARIQNPDGSFNEWYPNEHSFVATAFTSYAVSESVLLLGDLISRDQSTKDRVFPALEKAGRWLLKRNNDLVANHIAGALAALYNIYLITEKDIFRSGVSNKLECLKGIQTEEGWFQEYGGADVGYTCISLGYLARYLKRSGDKAVEPSIKKALNFIPWFVHPDGSAGGEYGSRSTRYLLPYAFEALSRSHPEARQILDEVFQDGEEGLYMSPEAIDDRYFAFFFLPDYAQALAETINAGAGEQRGGGVEEQGSAEACPRHGRNGLPVRRLSAVPAGQAGTQTGETVKGQLAYHREFPIAGLIVKRNASYYFAANLKKNGVFHLYSTRESLRIYSDVGYYGKTREGQVVSSQWLNPEANVPISSPHHGSEVEYNIEGRFVYADYSLPLKRALVPFRIFNYTAGRISWLMDRFQKRLRMKRILKIIPAPLMLKRRIRLEENRIVITDLIRTLRPISFQSFGNQEASNFQFSPTSCYHMKGLPDATLSTKDKARTRDMMNQRGEVNIVMEFDFYDDIHKLNVDIS